MKKAAIIDLDGTLCCTKHKQHLVDTNWDLWHQYIVFDDMNEWCYQVVQKAKEADYTVILLTARRFSPEVAYDTKLWLAKHNVPYDMLIGKNPNDNRPSHEYKKEELQKLQKSYAIQFAIDDEIENCKMFVSMGIPCHFCG